MSEADYSQHKEAIIACLGVFAIGFVEKIFVVGCQPQSQVGTVHYVAPVAPPGHSLSSLQSSEKEGGLNVSCILLV